MILSSWLEARQWVEPLCGVDHLRFFPLTCCTYKHKDKKILLNTENEKVCTLLFWKIKRRSSDTGVWLKLYNVLNMLEDFRGSEIQLLMQAHSLGAASMKKSQKHLDPSPHWLVKGLHAFTAGRSISALMSSTLSCWEIIIWPLR